MAQHSSVAQSIPKCFGMAVARNAMFKFAGTQSEFSELTSLGRFCHWVHIFFFYTFIRPGNCNMGKYSDYKTPMLADDSPCGPSS